MVPLPLSAVTPEDAASISLTHPAVAAQSATTTSSIPAAFIENNRDISPSLSQSGLDAGMLAAGVFTASVLRDNRPAELEVQTEGHDRKRIGDVVGKLAVRGHTTKRAALIAAEVVVAVFELADHVVGERVSKAGARSQTASATVELVDAEHRVGAGV